MIHTRAAIGLLALTFTVAGCSKDARTDEAVKTKTSTGDSATSMSSDAAESRNVALVRVVNAVPASPTLIVRSDSLHMLPGVAFKEVTPFQPVDKAWVKFEVGGGPGGAYSTLAADRAMLTDGNRYTMLIMRDKAGTGYDTRVLKDNVSADTTQAHLRIVHAAVGFESVSLVAKGGAALADGVKFESGSDFKDVIPFTGTVEVRSEKGNQLLLSVPDVAMGAGVASTIVLTRSGKGKLEAFWFVDKPIR